MSVRRSLTSALVSTLVLLASSLPANALPPGNATRNPPSPPIFDFVHHVDANDLDMFVTNVGSFAWDLLTGAPGLEYPQGTNKTVVYAGGIWVGALVGGAPRVTVSLYTQEYGPGPVIGGSYAPDWDNAYRVYKIRPADTPATNPDYAAWPFSQGAPFEIVAGDTVPHITGDQTLFSVYNDLNPSWHTDIAGSTAPLGIEIRETSFAFDTADPLGQTIIMQHRIINKGTNALTDTHIAIWADPDLGTAGDDLTGCDPARDMGYCYNGSPTDGVYGSAPPAVGFDLLRGPVDPQTHQPIGMTSFGSYTNGTDPSMVAQSWAVLHGLLRDGSPMVDPTTGLVTTFAYPGDPVLGTGWLDPFPADKRLLISCGPFNMAPGDTQTITTAIMVGQGISRMNSIEALRYTDDFVQAAFNRDFEPPTAIEIVSFSAERAGAGALVRWEVGEGSERTAFHVFREDAQGKRERLTKTPLTGQLRYEFADRSAPGDEAAYWLEAIERDGTSHWLGPVALAAAGVPRALTLAASPNPFVAEARLSFALPKDGPVDLAIYDAQGRRIALLVRETRNAGAHTAVWDGRGPDGTPAPAGIYWARLEAAGAVRTAKIALTR